MKLKLNLFVFLFLSLLVVNCNNIGKPKDFDYGRIENGKYLNSFFGFEVKLPTNWIIQNKEQIEEITKRGKEVVAGDDQNLKNALNASEINTANLLVVFKHELGAAVDYNPSFMLVAENLKNFPGIKKGSDYLFQSRKLLRQSQMQIDSIDEEFKLEIIDNQEFYLMNASISHMGMLIKQTYYSTIRNGFCLCAIISFTNTEQKDELEKVIKSMRFNK